MKTAGALGFFVALTGVLLCALLSNAPVPEQSKLRVCADPNNLPYSNQREEGFENRIAALIGKELGLEVEYTWWAQRRGYIRNTICAGLCDIYIGVPSGMDMLLVTAPYYRSTYVFVYRKDAGFRIDSLDAPELKELRVGVQIIGDDYANSPPAHALARRGIVQNVRGYSVIGDYSQPDPPARIVEAVALGEIDVAIAWGPMAGYFARKQQLSLDVVPVSPQADIPSLPFVYDISMGLRRGEEEFKNRIERAIAKHRAEIKHILDDYGVPQLAIEAKTTTSGSAGRT